MDWQSYLFFPLAEWRKVATCYPERDCRAMGGCTYVTERRWKPRTVPPAPPAPPVASPRPFDWLRDYGPLWEPDTLAFWLDPDTDAERTAWHRKYTTLGYADEQALDILYLNAAYANQASYGGLQAANAYRNQLRAQYDYNQLQAQYGDMSRQQMYDYRRGLGGLGGLFKW